MDFIDQIKQFSKRVESIKENLQTEEATKTSIIMPFFAMLGYDVFNPLEFTPEFTADVGIKKGEKVDYAIMINGDPSILVEAKWIGSPLEVHQSQLFRYFGTTTAKFGILTNGQIYKFYTDLDAVNKMDLKPFLEIDILDIKEASVHELKKFCKSTFDVDELLNTASELRYSNAFSRKLTDELEEPSDDFVRFFLTDIYDGQKTQTTIEKFRPVLKRTLNNRISEMMNEKIKTALSGSQKPEKSDSLAEEVSDDADTKPSIVTTQEEKEACIIVRSLLAGTVDPEKIFHRDTASYFGILYNDNNRLWICRLKFLVDKIVLLYPDEEKNEIRFDIDTIYDLAKFKEQLIEVVKRYL